jgi:hypothetical protein
MTDITALSAQQDEANRLALRRTGGFEVAVSRITEHITVVALHEVGADCAD